MNKKTAAKKTAAKKTAAKKTAAKKTAAKKTAAKNSNAGTPFSYSALKFSQRDNSEAPELVLFYAPAQEILEWAEVDSLGPSTTGPQRAKKDSKVIAISKFMDADERNTIPTAVTLAFQEARVSFDPRTLQITFRGSRENPAATIVDGQHRLLGIKLYNPSIKVAAVGLLESDEVERAFQFLVINNKATKVATTHIKALIARMRRTSLDQRLKGAKIAFDAEGINDVNLVNLDRDSPFHQSVDWAISRGEKMVQATAIELSLHHLGSLGVAELEDRDVRRSIFLTIWKIIREEWADLWHKKSRLVSKVGIICLTRFIGDLIVKWADNEDLGIEITDLDTIEKQTQKIIKHMDRRFWTTQWAETAQGGFDTAQGRDRVLAAITQLYRNSREGKDWYYAIDIIDAAAAKGEPAAGSGRKSRRST